MSFSFFLTAQRHAVLKEDIGRDYPEISPSNRVEALARGLGFRTNASCRAALDASPRVTPQPAAFLDFLESKGFPRDGRGFGWSVAKHDPRPHDQPRLAATVDAESRRPWYSPCIVIPGKGVLHADETAGPWSRETTEEAALSQLLEEIQNMTFTVPHSGTDSPWYQRFWIDTIPRGTLSGRSYHMMYIGMGHWMIDFGPALPNQH